MADPRPPITPRPAPARPTPVKHPRRSGKLAPFLPAHMKSPHYKRGLKAVPPKEQR